MRRLLLISCLYVAAAFVFATYLAATARAQSCNLKTGCPAPTTNYAPATVYVQQARTEPAVWIKQYKIEHDGLTFVVEGYRLHEGGNVTWETDRPFNVRTQNAAVRKERERLQAVVEKPPTILPAETPSHSPAGQLTGDPFPGGVDLTRSGKPGYTSTGSAEAKRFIEEVQAPKGDSEMLHVTVIGKPEDRAQVLKDLEAHPSLSPLRAGLMIQSYSADEWAIDPKSGFPAHGTPSILLQMPRRSKGDPKGGKVLWRVENYKGGPESLAEAIRKTDPGYDSRKDPGIPSIGGGGKCPLGFTRAHWPYIVGVLLLLAILTQLPRKAG